MYNKENNEKIKNLSKDVEKLHEFQALQFNAVVRQNIKICNEAAKNKVLLIHERKVSEQLKKKLEDLEAKMLKLHSDHLSAINLLNKKVDALTNEDPAQNDAEPRPAELEEEHVEEPVLQPEMFIEYGALKTFLEYSMSELDSDSDSDE